MARLVAFALALAVTLGIVVVPRPCGAADAPDKPTPRDIVVAAEFDPMNAEKLALAKSVVEAELAVVPPTISSRLLAAKVAILDSKRKLDKERRTILNAGLKRLDEANKIDWRDPAPWKQRMFLLQEMGIHEDELLEATRAWSIRAPADPTARRAYHAATGKVPQLRVGDPFPEVIWKDGQGQDVKSPTLWAKGPAVIELYRSAVWCPYCQQQILSMEAKWDEFVEEHVNVVACSPDTSETIAGIEKDGLKGRKPFHLKLLSDPKGNTADLLGVLNPETVKPTTPPDGYGLPFPTTFIVDGQGIIRFVKTHGDHRERVKPEEMLIVANRIKTETSGK